MWETGEVGEDGGLEDCAGGVGFVVCGGVGGFGSTVFEAEDVAGVGAADYKTGERIFFIQVSCSPEMKDGYVPTRFGFSRTSASRFRGFRICKVVGPSMRVITA